MWRGLARRGLLRGLSARARSTQVAPPASEAQEGVASTLRRFGVQRVRPWLAEALAAANFREPSAIQAAVMPRVSRREDVVIHAPTGSGKTLAYLVPVLSRLEPQVPFQLLVLVPSRELALQVAGQMEQLFRGSTSTAPKLSLLLGGVTPKATDDALGAADAAKLQCAELLKQEPEVLVATPQSLLRVLRVRDEPVGRLEWDEFDQWSGQEEGDGQDQRRRSQKPRPNLLTQLLGANLDALVLDEVDALMPPPKLRDDLGYHRRRDWKNLNPDERRAARRAGGPLEALLFRLAKASPQPQQPLQPLQACSPTASRLVLCTRLSPYAPRRPPRSPRRGSRGCRAAVAAGDSPGARRRGGGCCRRGRSRCTSWRPRPRWGGRCCARCSATSSTRRRWRWPRLSIGAAPRRRQREPGDPTGCGRTRPGRLGAVWVAWPCRRCSRTWRCGCATRTGLPPPRSRWACCGPRPCCSSCPTERRCGGGLMLLPRYHAHGCDRVHVVRGRTDACGHKAAHVWLQAVCMAAGGSSSCGRQACRRRCRCTRRWASPAPRRHSKRGHDR